MQNSKKLPYDDSPEGRLRKRYAEILADRDYLDAGSTRHKQLHQERKQIWEEIERKKGSIII